MAIPVIHRRNRIDQLAGLPRGCWVEIDADIHEGVVYLHHDPLSQQPDKMVFFPDRLENFLPRAIEAGVGGFVIDCKRENVEKLITPMLEKFGVTSYFYLNEMEIQADIFLAKNPMHQSGIRLWKYRGADEILRYCHDAKEASGSGPSWVWVDCWQRGLDKDIHRAFLPLDGKQAKALQTARVRLCICSPELYVHQYGKEYSAAEMKAFEAGVKAYRDNLAAANIAADAICTKFPAFWGL